LGEKDPEFAATLNNVAAFYKALGDYDRAERCYRQAVLIKKEVRGELNPDYALSLNNLAALYLDRADFARACPVARTGDEHRQANAGEGTKTTPQPE